MMNGLRDHRGFTLIEMIVTMIIMSIVAAMVAVFIPAPVKGYVDTVRRAALTDEADTLIRFMTRELRSAAPNSISCTSCSGGSGTLTLWPVLTAARYREYPAAAGSGNMFAFGTAVSSFDFIGVTSLTDLGPDSHGVPLASCTGLVGNLGSSTSACDVNNAGTTNKFTITGISGGTATVSPAVTVSAGCGLASPASSDPNDRTFGGVFCIGAQVTYVCGASGLTRNGQLLSSRVTSCLIGWPPAVSNASIQTIPVQLTLSQAGESVTLFREIHVDNYP